MDSSSRQELLTLFNFDWYILFIYFCSFISYCLIIWKIGHSKALMFQCYCYWRLWLLTDESYFNWFNYGSLKHNSLHIYMELFRTFKINNCVNFNSNLYYKSFRAAISLFQTKAFDCSMSVVRKNISKLFLKKLRYLREKFLRFFLFYAEKFVLKC